jgi:uncharacterized protein YjbI with pentapeptide repeats
MIVNWVEEKTYTSIIYAGQKLVQTEFESCVFLNCDFSNADFSESDFLNCTFEGCNFSLAKFAGTGLKGVQFKGCKLIGIGFDHCSDFLFSVGFQKCTMDYTSFAEKKMKKTKFEGCSLKEADFADADLSQSVFEDCDCFGAVFQNTNLEKADLRTAINYSIDPETNKIRQAKFSYSGISGLLTKYNLDIE